MTVSPQLLQTSIFPMKLLAKMCRISCEVGFSQIVHQTKFDLTMEERMVLLTEMWEWVMKEN